MQSAFELHQRGELLCLRAAMCSACVCGAWRRDLRLLPPLAAAVVLKGGQCLSLETFLARPWALHSGMAHAVQRDLRHFLAGRVQFEPHTATRLICSRSLQRMSRIYRHPQQRCVSVCLAEDTVSGWTHPRCHAVFRRGDCWGPLATRRCSGGSWCRRMTAPDSGVRSSSQGC
jgi:hypothetical protein